MVCCMLTYGWQREIRQFTWGDFSKVVVSSSRFQGGVNKSLKEEIQ